MLILIKMYRLSVRKNVYRKLKEMYFILKVFLFYFYTKIVLYSHAYSIIILCVEKKYLP